ncbi:hypothetical protein KDA_58260 [Dictyobacter alpinus]|uniref:Uncharacterized protein n=1 Tax=Dictyobacter alpinus TaxID=2014873 RepID=A0A402BGA7_9CHLR|nr:hypothetical protein KDA_57940 [Dictyobacter alpinus]GCE30342.1 hypothetical protein KDA_58260 [Dictyobacter alpinus]
MFCGLCPQNTHTILYASAAGARRDDFYIVPGEVSALKLQTQNSVIIKKQHKNI